MAFSSRKKTNAFRRGSAGPVFQTRKIKYLKSNKIGQDAKADGRSLRRYSGPGKHKQARSNRLGDRISRKRPHSSWSERAQHGHYLTTGESKTRCGYLRYVRPLPELLNWIIILSSISRWSDGIAIETIDFTVIPVVCNRPEKEKT